MSATISSERKGAQKQDVDSDLRARIRETFERQQAHRWKVATTTADERIAKLKRLKKLMLDRRGELLAAMAKDFRKPAAEVDLTELQPVLGEINHTIKHLKSWMQPMKVPTPPQLLGTRSMVRYEPKGLVLILAPWNYPFNLLMSPLVAAVAAGNCVVVRPSDKVRETSALMATMLRDVFPEEEVAVFTGPSSIANLLLELPFDHIFFTGSTRIGKQVMHAAAEHLGAVTLELGGQSPVVVDETADIDTAAQRLVWGKFLNGGQTCVAPNHVFVHASKQAEFVAAARRYIEKHYGATEEERQKSPHLCRIVDAPSEKRLRDVVERSVAAGARLEVGGRYDPADRYVAPTVLSNVKDDMPVMEAELFGPIMPVVPYESLDEVISAIQRRGKPLAMYVFSESDRNIERLLSNTTAGGTVINNCIIHLANPDLPFGGIGASGMGNYHGFFGFRALSHERAVMVQSRLATVRLFYPPYTKVVQRAIDALTKVFALQGR